MKKPGIPSTPKPGEERAKFDNALRLCAESIMGRRGSKIALLDPATATAADCAAKINEILRNLQDE